MVQAGNEAGLEYRESVLSAGFTPTMCFMIKHFAFSCAILLMFIAGFCCFSQSWSILKSFSIAGDLSVIKNTTHAPSALKSIDIQPTVDS